MNFIKKLFSHQTTIEETYSGLDGEDITQYECEFIRKTLKCCDCGTGTLLEGPSGGCSVNVMCGNENCGSRFNLGPGLIFSARISDKAPLA